MSIISSVVNFAIFKKYNFEMKIFLENSVFYKNAAVNIFEVDNETTRWVIFDTRSQEKEM